MATSWITHTESDVSTIPIFTTRFTGIAGITIPIIILLSHSHLVADGADILIMAGAVATGVVIIRLITAAILHIGAATHPTIRDIPFIRFIQFIPEMVITPTDKEDRQEQLPLATMEEDLHREKWHKMVQQEIKVQTVQLQLREEDLLQDRELVAAQEEIPQKQHRQVF
jgi:hypothetical protein